MPKPSDSGEDAKQAVRLRRDEPRKLEPETIDRLSAALDRSLAEMCGLSIDDKPIQGRSLARIAEHARTMQLLVNTFVEDVERLL